MTEGTSTGLQPVRVQGRNWTKGRGGMYKRDLYKVENGVTTP